MGEEQASKANLGLFYDQKEEKCWLHKNHRSHGIYPTGSPLPWKPGWVRVTVLDTPGLGLCTLCLHPDLCRTLGVSQEAMAPSEPGLQSLETLGKSFHLQAQLLICEQVAVCDTCCNGASLHHFPWALGVAGKGIPQYHPPILLSPWTLGCSGVCQSLASNLPSYSSLQDLNSHSPAMNMSTAC